MLNSIREIAEPFEQLARQWQENREDSVYLEPIVDPVVASCGHIFDRQSAIKLFGRQEEISSPREIRSSQEKKRRHCPLCTKHIVSYQQSPQLKVLFSQGDLLAKLGLRLVEQNQACTRENTELTATNQELLRDLKGLMITRERLGNKVRQLEKENDRLTCQISDLTSNLVIYCQPAHFICEVEWQKSPIFYRGDDEYRGNGEKIMRLNSTTYRSLLESVEVIGNFDGSTELNLSCWHSKQHIFHKYLLSHGLSFNEQHPQIFNARGFLGRLKAWEFFLNESVFVNTCHRHFLKEICTTVTHWEFVEHKLLNPYQEAKKLIQRMSASLSGS